MALLLALDFGGTKLSAALLEQGQRTWLALERAFSKPQATATDDLELMTTLAERLLKGKQPEAIGVSFGGPVLASEGLVRLSDHVAGWENLPLANWLEERYGAPATVDNDANVAALGEYHYGAGRGCDSLLYVTVSTGVGGGWILGGRPWRGADGMAGEIGHAIADPHGPLCYCGQHGCVERLASGPYIADYARELLKAEPQRASSLRTIDNFTAKEVARAANEGDALAWQALERSAWALGIGLGNAVNFINPERVVLGGGVTKSGERYLKRVYEVALSVARPHARLDLVTAQLGDDAPLWGAVALAGHYLRTRGEP
jgi:glucokinase